MKRRRLRTGEIPEDIMEEILQGIGRMANGETVLVAQDGILAQVEFAEKRRVEHWDDALPQDEFHTAAWQRLAGRIAHEFAKLQFGRLTVVVKQGHVVQLERTEKQRFTGLDGEGI